MISIICPIYNEESCIEQCIDSILQQDVSESFELLLVDGGSTDRTRELILPYLKKYDFIRLLHNTKRTAPCAMNIGIQAAMGEIIIRIDAHSEYPNDYCSRLVAALRTLNGAENVGGGFFCVPKDKSKTAESICAVLSHPLGVGNGLFRIGAKEIQEVDTVPFGCFRKSIFEKVGFYNEKLTRNQDIELNERIRKSGGKIYLLPDLQIKYKARSTYSALAKNNFGNGLWNILTLYYTRNLSALSFRHFVPLLFVLSLIIPTLMMLVNPLFGILTAVSLCAYLILIIGVSVNLNRSKKCGVFHLIFAFSVLHFSYGWGGLVGMLKVLGKCFSRG